MFKSNLGLLGFVAVLVIAGLALWQRQARALRQENAALRQEVTQFSKLSDEVQRFSTLLAQTRAAQAHADEHAQELLRLRTELNQLRDEQARTNQLSQEKLAQSVSDQVRELASLRSELGEVADEIGYLHDSIQQLQGAVVSSPAEEPSAQRGATDDTRAAVSLRMIQTHPERFAEKLKSSTAAQENETFQEVFRRFLRSNGVDLSTVSGMVFDERTGRVVVRASQPTLDVIERLTLALDRGE